jgi:glycine/D-amino acid oxidase-like deaminating enzyme
MIQPLWPKNLLSLPLLPKFSIRKQRIALEPLLNPAAISGVLRLPHGHINAEKTNLAYQQAFLRLGGTDYSGSCHRIN